VRFALFVVALAAGARAAEPPTIAVTEFQSDASDRDKAKGLSGVVAARLS
jgi:hypothetical protein